MDTKKLRQKILDLAIRGKLVPQDPNDEPASVLLERIRAEKERLIAEGKIKCPKKSKATSAGSHYRQFEIPDTWKWTTLEELIILISGQDFPSDKYSSTPKGVPYIIGASNIQNGKVVVTRWTESPTVLSEKNDLLIVCKGAGVGKMGINQIGTSHIARQIQALRPFSRYVSLEYIRVALMNGIEIICSQANGLIPGLPRDLLLKFPIPLPPLAEQMKIVNRIASALDNINALEMEARAAQDYISLLKSKILDLAMQGKLVPQDASNEPAADMLLRINPKAKIITDNPHYPQLPDNWVTTSIETINEYQPETVNPAINPAQTFELYSVPIFGTGSPEYLLGNTIGSAKQVVKKGDVLLCKINPHINRVWELTNKSGLVQIASSEWIVVRSSALNPSFLKYYFESPEFRKLLCSQVSGVGGSLTRAQPAVVKKYEIPIPPYKEQLRIVQALVSWLEILEIIKSTLN